MQGLLDTIQGDMFARARDVYHSRLREVRRWEDFVPTLDDKCVVVIPWCEEEACEDDIKERSAKASEPTDERAPSAGAKSLCIPFEQASPLQSCELRPVIVQTLTLASLSSPRALSRARRNA